MVSSRLCVKNLPKYMTEDRLRDFFSQKGEITDTKLLRTKDGKSRQFAFIGFRTEQEGEEAIKYFNNSYLDTCRITCEVARKVGDPNTPRPWSRYSAKKCGQLDEKNKDKAGVGVAGLTFGNSKGAGTASETTNSSKTDVNGNPQLQEFLQIMQPRSKSKLWGNDALGPSQLAENNVKAEVKEAQSCKDSKKQSAKMLGQIMDGGDKENEMDLEKMSSGVSDTSKDKISCDLAKDELISDMDYFKSRVKKNWSDSETDDEQSLGGVASTDKNPKESQNPSGDEPDVTRREISFGDAYGAKTGDNKLSAHEDENKQALDTGRLFVRNLPYTTNEDELLELFSKFGEVSQVHLVVDKDSKRSKGIGYVLYALPESAVRALEELDNSIFQGRLLHVMPAKPQNPTAKQETTLASGQTTKSFKEKREEQRKTSEIGGDTRAWNSFFIRQDTVVENIARKYGVSKSDVLDQEADDLPVRVALGETHAIAETKKALTSAGVNIAALEELASGKTTSIRRSNHVILVKNLPYGSSEGDLIKMFEKFGSLDKVILPPTKALALVIFLEAAESRAAFKGLAYKRYKDAPLYLEWAPEHIMSLNPTSAIDEQKNVIGKEEIKRVLLEQNVEQVPEVDIDPDRVESRSVFVKNLNFKSSDDSLKKHFFDSIKKGRILSAKVKKHIKNGKNVSMGYGFIEFDSLETATDICRDLQGTILDGHALILQLCHAKRDVQAQKKVEKDKSSTKLIVRNVAFEATEKDLRQLFSPFGQIRSLRLPMKFGNHRGFAFVEFVTKQEAQNALEALSSTHLYGRHLVLERAKEGESLEELRARTAAQFADYENGNQKLSKKRKHMAIVDEDKVKFERVMD